MVATAASNTTEGHWLSKSPGSLAQGVNLDEDQTTLGHLNIPPGYGYAVTAYHFDVFSPGKTSGLRYNIVAFPAGTSNGTSSGDTINNTQDEKSHKEVEGMSEYVSKDAFDAHVRRIDDHMSSMETIIVERMSSMEGRINGKIDRLIDTVAGMAEREERLIQSNKEVIAETKKENSHTRWTMLGLTLAVIVGLLASMVPIGWEIVRTILKG